MSEIENCCGTTCDKASIAAELKAKDDKIAELQNDVLAKSIADLTRHNSVLQAQVSKLRKALEFFADDELLDIEAVSFANDVLHMTPAQCLAEIKAQAALDGFIDGAHFVNAASGGVFSHEEIENTADGYANQLLQKVKKLD